MKNLTPLKSEPSPPHMIYEYSIKADHVENVILDRMTYLTHILLQYPLAVSGKAKNNRFGYCTYPQPSCPYLVDMESETFCCLLISKFVLGFPFFSLKFPILYESMDFHCICPKRRFICSHGPSVQWLHKRWPAASVGVGVVVCHAFFGTF